MRCKCCDKILDPREVNTINAHGEYEDLCRHCKKQVFLDIHDILVVREYQFESITEALPIDFDKKDINDNNYY